MKSAFFVQDINNVSMLEASWNDVYQRAYVFHCFAGYRFSIVLRSSIISVEELLVFVVDSRPVASVNGLKSKSMTSARSFVAGHPVPAAVNCRC